MPRARMAASVTSVNLESTRSRRLSVRGSMSEARRSGMTVAFLPGLPVRRAGRGWGTGLRGRSGLPVHIQNSSDLVGSSVWVVVHDDGVEAVRESLLGVGLGQPAFDRSGIILPPGDEAPPLLFSRRRADERQHGVRVRLLDR